MAREDDITNRGSDTPAKVGAIISTVEAIIMTPVYGIVLGQLPMSIVVPKFARRFCQITKEARLGIISLGSKKWKASSNSVSKNSSFSVTQYKINRRSCSYGL